MKGLVLLAVLVCVCGAVPPFIREVTVPLGSINELGNWIQQVPRSKFLDCPTNENRFGLVCDTATTSRDDLDNYFCGRSPAEFGWCGEFWNMMGQNDQAWYGNMAEKRGVSNGALPIAYKEKLNMYQDMFMRVCSCHCGCSAGCTSSTSGSVASAIACGISGNLFSPGVVDFPVSEISVLVWARPIGGSIQPIVATSSSPGSTIGGSWSATIGVSPVANQAEIAVMVLYNSDSTQVGHFVHAGAPSIASMNSGGSANLEFQTPYQYDVLGANVDQFSGSYLQADSGGPAINSIDVSLDLGSVPPTIQISSIT